MRDENEVLLDVAGLVAVGTWELDIAGDRLSWSTAMRVIHGVPLDFAPTLETATAFFAPEARAIMRDAVAQAVTDGRSWDLELPLIRLDGRRIVVRAAGVAVIEDGRPVRLSGVLQDVTAAAAERQALRSANERLMLATRAGKIGIWDWDIANDRMVWDPVMYALYDRLPGQGTETVEIWRSSLHPDDRPRAEQALQDSFDGHTAFETQFRVVWSDGSVRYLRGAGSVSRDAEGRPVRMLGSNWDVTDETLLTREKIEREVESKAAAAERARAADERSQTANLMLMLQHGEARFRAALSAVQGVLWTNDVMGRMVGEQPGWAALTGQAQHEYQGHGWALAVHPDDAQPTIDAWNEAVAARRTFVFEHRVRRHDGRWRIFAVRAVPLFEADGGCIQEWVGVHTDITEQREAEAALSRSNLQLSQTADEFRTLADGMAELCWMAEPDGRIYWYNRRWYEYTGKSLAEMEGWGWQSIHDPEALPTVMTAWQAAIAAGTDFTMTFPLKGADGAFRSFLTRIVPSFGPDGKVSRWLGTNVDVTELNNMNQILEERVQARTVELKRLAGHLGKARDAAEQASQAKSRFLAGMSHELRTPLSGILGYAHLLQMDGSLNPKQTARLDTMIEAGRHLQHMINRVLDLTEIESRHLDLQVSEFDIRHVSETCLEVIRPLAEDKGLLLDFTVAAGTPRTLRADATRLRQVLLNLLGNAVKFTARGTVAMRLRTSTDGTALRIEIADTGPGVPAEKRGRLFQEFERLDTEATRAAEGSGLGLSLSMRLAEKMGGRLGHEDNRGGGSVFWLEMPIDTSAMTMISAVDDPIISAVPPLDRKLQVLVVDDVLMNREIAGSFLSAAGHRVTSAEGGLAAVAAVAETDFDVVLMDVRMPEMDGLEATRRIRALAGTRGRVPIVALTAQAFVEQVAACRQAGMDFHLAKPFEVAELLAVVTRAAAAGPGARVEPDPASTQLIAPATEAKGAGLPVLNILAFERTAVHLTPEAVASYLRTIAQLGETLMRGLDNDADMTAPGDTLIDLVHKLSGSAGVFGFERVADAGRAFERALQLHSGDRHVLAEQMRAATVATCREIHARLAVGQIAP